MESHIQANIKKALAKEETSLMGRTLFPTEVQEGNLTLQIQIPCRQFGQGHKQRLEKTDLIPAGPPERRTPKLKLDVTSGTSLTS